MSLNVLSKDILFKAEKEKENILENLKLEKDSLEVGLEDELGNFKSGKKEEFEKEFLLESKKIESFFKKESRNNILETKSSILDSLFEDTLLSLYEKKPDFRKKVFERFVERAKSELEIGTIICNKANSKILKELVSSVKIRVVDGVEGVIFETPSGNERLDMTYKSMLKDIFDNNEDKIQKILFGENGTKTTGY